jgi:hypothetical protein
MLTKLEGEMRASGCGSTTRAPSILLPALVNVPLNSITYTSYENFILYHTAVAYTGIRTVHPGYVLKIVPTAGVKPLRAAKGPVQDSSDANRLFAH